MDLTYRDLSQRQTGFGRMWLVFDREEEPDPFKHPEHYVAVTIFIAPSDEDHHTVYVGWLGVREDRRREGIASAILDHIHEVYRCPIDFGATLKDGEELQRAYFAKHPERLVTSG